MNKKVFIVIIVSMTVLLFIFLKSTPKGGLLVNPKTGQTGSIDQPLPTDTYNPPQEIKYDSVTDLEQELDSIDPKVLDSDFE